MAHEQTDLNAVKAGIAAQWRALKSEADRDDVREFLAELTGGVPGFEPKLPLEGSPDYDPNKHGPRSHEELEQMLVDGLNSGPAVDATPGFWQERRAEYFRSRGIEFP